MPSAPDPALAVPFTAGGQRYRHYRMSRGANPLLDLYAVWQLVRIFREEQPEVVHTFDTKPGVSGTAGGQNRRRSCGDRDTAGSGRPLVDAQVGEESWFGSLISLFQTLASRVADLTVFQNEDDAHEFERRHVVKHDRITVIPGSGVRTDVLVGAPPWDAEPLLRAELAPDHGLVVVMIWRDTPGPRACLISRLRHRRDPARGTRRSTFSSWVRLTPTVSMPSTVPELEELRSSITWAGRRSDVKSVLALTDIFKSSPPTIAKAFHVSCSRRRRWAPAHRRGRPRLPRSRRRRRQRVPHTAKGTSGDLEGTAVLRLADAPELRQRFGHDSRSRAVTLFDSALVADRIESLYRTLLSGKTGRLTALGSVGPYSPVPAIVDVCSEGRPRRAKTAWTYLAVSVLLPCHHRG